MEILAGEAAITSQSPGNEGNVAARAKSWVTFQMAGLK